MDGAGVVGSVLSASGAGSKGPPESPKAWAIWLGRVLGGVGLTGTLYLFHTKHWSEAWLTLSTSLAVFLLRPIVRFVRRFFQQLQLRMDKGADALADRAVDKLIGWVQGRISSMFSGHWEHYCKHLEYRFRTYRTQGLKTRGAFSPDLEKVYVPLRISPCSPNKISPDIVGRASSEKATQIWDFLVSDSEPAYRRMAVLARPGAGKTTLLVLLRQISYRHKRTHQRLAITTQC